MIPVQWNHKDNRTRSFGPIASPDSLFTMRQHISLIALLVLAALLIAQAHAAPVSDDDNSALGTPNGTNATVNHNITGTRDRATAVVTAFQQPKSPLATVTPQSASAGRGTRERSDQMYPEYSYCFRPFHKNPDGWCNLCLDVEQSRQTHESAEAQIWRCNGNERAQMFKVRRSPASREHQQYWEITADNGRWCLDVPGGNAFEGQRVRWWTCNGSIAQAWDFFALDGPALYTWVTYWKPAVNNQLCLDALGGPGGRRFGQHVGLWSCNYGPAQNLKTFRGTALPAERRPS
ncbi:hypothetical protein BCR44DRAFT_1216765 [Catenaria anguillulae PL171]|uniref:Ricin B lectin domain-containing protein n=1 Tax=Catenaria anguillulae PL171 TaxID=765915 RepID=A0A1Y2I1N1_9FUNG|nr:hypothetical protein BCR44DRAFT_1216765 [Catenaria anguillulae PL171]